MSCRPHTGSHTWSPHRAAVRATGMQSGYVCSLVPPARRDSAKCIRKVTLTAVHSGSVSDTATRPPAASCTMRCGRLPCAECVLRLSAGWGLDACVTFSCDIGVEHGRLLITSWRTSLPRQPNRFSANISADTAELRSLRFANGASVWIRSGSGRFRDDNRHICTCQHHSAHKSDPDIRVINGR